MTFELIGTSYEIPEEALKKAAEAAFEYLGGDFEVNLRFVEGDEMIALNKLYRGQEKATDVLSFQTETGVYGGDIAFYYFDLKKDADEWGMSTTDTACFLLVHSILHLTGMDHANDEERATMEKAEEEILESIGIKLKR